MDEKQQMILECYVYEIYRGQGYYQSRETINASLWADGGD